MSRTGAKTHDRLPRRAAAAQVRGHARQHSEAVLLLDVRESSAVLRRAAVSGDPSGSPVLILSRPALIPLLHTVTVAAVTSTLRGTPTEVVLRVDDEARQGALRLAEAEGGPFLAASETTRIPPLIELPRLLTAAENVVGDTDSDEDLRLLLAPGSSLGGARPKASIRDRDGHLVLAKFPHRDDETDTVRWEATALALARWRSRTVANVDSTTLVVRRWIQCSAGKSMTFLPALEADAGPRRPDDPTTPGAGDPGFHMV